jgi:hypothetical protein
MKRTFLAFLIVGLTGASAYSECTYFRLSANLLKCEAVDAKALEASNPYQPAQDIPELQDPTTPSIIQITCSCEYSLSGSDPRCDMDQTVEKSSILGVDHPSETCRRGKILCKDVCPSRLP